MRTTKVPIRLIVVLVVCLSLVPRPADAAGCNAARMGCVAAASWASRACQRNCERLGDKTAVATCRADCRTERRAAEALCRDVDDPCAVACADGAPQCPTDVRTCRRTARRAHHACRAQCADRRDMRCLLACDRTRAAAEASCGFVAVRTNAGPGEVPVLPLGRPADLSVLLDDAELAVVAAADARAETLRSRPLRLWVGRPGATVTVTQTKHAFTFGFPIDFRELQDRPDDLAFYGSIAAAHTSEMVLETSLKWRVGEPAPGVMSFDLADAELAWGEGLGFHFKGHTLLWGNARPFSTGSGIPDWVLAQFPNATLTPAEQETLRGLLKRRVEAVVGRYRGRIDVWDVTNETLNPFTQWFIQRLGPGIVNDMFAWVRAIDPGCELVFNEWIREVFTGVGGPGAADVRDRVTALRAAGVPIDAIGQQGHFVPGVVYAGGTADLSQRTRIDDYQAALDTLAQAGVPVHITETNFIAPDEPEKRAAQAEALMRVWWGHPAVEQVVFWALWNAVAARQQLQSGLWDDAGVLTRHGEAVVSLLNDRWRTHATVVADAHGVVELRATLGDYIASWDENGAPVHATFRVDRGSGTAMVAAVTSPCAPGGRSRVPSSRSRRMRLRMGATCGQCPPA
jgi:GH35 family endo-1,4-beta-xylanase